jgi:molybdate transport system substrate-binding protein
MVIAVSYAVTFDQQVGLRQRAAMSSQHDATVTPETEYHADEGGRSMKIACFIRKRHALVGSSLLLAVGLVCSNQALAQVKVIMSGGFTAAFRSALPEFERTTGIAVTVGSGASQGDGPETIGAQLRRGVPADMVIMSREGLNDLIAGGRIVAGSDVDLAQAPLGVAVRAGAPKPDIGSVEAFRQTLLHAKSIVVPGSTTGIYLTTTLFPRFGVDSKKVKVTARGTQSAAMVAAGDAELVIQPVSELLPMPGIDFVGPIPSEVQYISVFSAAVVTGSKESEASKRLISFLASEKASGAIKQAGMEPANRH